MIFNACVRRKWGSPDLLVQTGRQRDRVAARALLVYAGREWSGLSVKELGRRLHRDPSMISRLYAHYVSARTRSWEKRVLGLLNLINQYSCLTPRD
jgi:hypothetical protein